MLSEGIIEYTVHIWQEGNQFIAHAMPMDVMSSGLTPESARKALDEAVRVFLITLEDMGTTEEVLQECGYQLIQGSWKSPPWVSIERHSAAVGI
jgi:predicted RNase H-like HicB family nuclease